MAFTALAPIVVLMIYACITAYLLVTGWRTVTVGTKIRGALLSLSCLAIANYMFVVHIVQYALHGGGITNGKIENGHYFVGNHARYTEVSQQFWQRTSHYQEISGWV